jgi:hypothetical protein
MSSTTGTALRALLAAALLGVYADRLFHSVDLGINALLWVTALATASVAIGREAPTTRATLRWFGPALALAAFLAIRESPALRALDILAMVTSLGLPVMVGAGFDPLRSDLGRYLRGALVSAVNVALGPLLLLTDVGWNELGAGGKTKALGSVAAGLAIAAPMVAVFGGLFASADPTFAAMVEQLFGWDIPAFADHLLWVGVTMWLSAGLLRAWLLSTVPAVMLPPLPRPSASAATLGTVQVSLLLLFVAFLALQFRYLFGGRAFLEQEVGLTVAEYARRGFFESVAAAGLAVPVVWGATALRGSMSEGAIKSLEAFAHAQLLLILVLLGSAVSRMALYVASFGLTEERLYASAALVWITAVVAAFSRTVLRGRSDLFPFRVAATGFAVLLALNAINPSGLVVRVNVAHAERTGQFDAQYVLGLGADAVPGLAGGLGSLGTDDRCRIAAQVYGSWGGVEGGDWRGFNLGRWRAERAGNQLGDEARRCRSRRTTVEAGPAPRPSPVAPAPARTAPPAGN